MELIFEKEGTVKLPDGQTVGKITLQPYADLAKIGLDEKWRFFFPDKSMPFGKGHHLSGTISQHPGGKLIDFKDTLTQLADPQSPLSLALTPED